MKNAVPIFGSDRTLLAIRSMVLESAGYEPIEVLTESSFDLPQQPWKIAVLCSSLRQEVREKLAHEIERHSPDTKIVVILRPSEAREDDTARVVYSDPDPEHIVKVCHRLLSADPA